jgi:hypothetical protein
MRRVWAASALLMLGVALVASTAETHVVWWSLGGYLCLLFVPPLVVDAARCAR